MPDSFISIDQNSNVLWDTVPKLAALARRGWRGLHCVEDVDVAFTRQGTTVAETGLALAPERFYRSGNSDWGAALFYTDFLGRNAVNPRVLEPYTGFTTAALARKLDCSVDEFYERYAGSDNWQLIGPSYAGDAHHHRTIGDLGVREAAPFLQELLSHAKEDLDARFPETAARQRVRAWHDAERALVADLIARYAAAPLVDLYQGWLQAHLGDSPEVGVSSAFFTGAPELPRTQLLERFVANYRDWATLYNDAIAETGIGLKPLQLDKGELPFFAVWRRPAAERGGLPRLVRTALSLEDGLLRAGPQAWPAPPRAAHLPIDDMRTDGLVCVSGKALLLVLQARLVPGGAPLVLPYNGSLYMPGAWRFEHKLRNAGLLADPVHPVYRVRFQFVRRWAGMDTRVRVPEYLRGVFSADELPASIIAAELDSVLERARRELAECTTKEGRDARLAAWAPTEFAAVRDLEVRRRELARAPETRAQAGQLWDEIKGLDKKMWETAVRRILQNLHVLNLDYWDSRGALYPWALALGGPAFYDRLLSDAEIYPENG